MDILQYAFFQHALWGSLFLSIACGFVGTYIVTRRMVFISGGITHASFGGLGLGFFLGGNPFLYALGFAVLSAFGVEWITQSRQVREDSAIAAVWSLGMALGVLFIVITPGYAPNLTSFLFGNILTITRADLLWMGLFVCFLLLFCLLFFREIIYVAFDRDFALTQRISVKWIEYMMIVAISITIIFSIRLVGIMLLMSMLTVPQMMVNLFTFDYKKIVLGSILLGFGACVTGLFCSYYLQLPSGAFIIILLIVLFLISKAACYPARKKAQQQ